MSVNENDKYVTDDSEAAIWPYVIHGGYFLKSVIDGRIVLSQQGKINANSIGSGNVNNSEFEKIKEIQSIKDSLENNGITVNSAEPEEAKTTVDGNNITGVEVTPYYGLPFTSVKVRVDTQENYIGIVYLDGTTVIEATKISEDKKIVIGPENSIVDTKLHNGIFLYDSEELFTTITLDNGDYYKTDCPVDVISQVGYSVIFVTADAVFVYGNKDNSLSGTNVFNGKTVFNAAVFYNSVLLQYEGNDIIMDCQKYNIGKFSITKNTNLILKNAINSVYRIGIVGDGTIHKMKIFVEILNEDGTTYDAEVYPRVGGIDSNLDTQDPSYIDRSDQSIKVKYTGTMEIEVFNQARFGFVNDGIRLNPTSKY